jgi:hypothetical protein
LKGELAALGHDLLGTEEDGLDPGHDHTVQPALQAAQVGLLQQGMKGDPGYDYTVQSALHIISGQKGDPGHDHTVQPALQAAQIGLVQQGRKG